MSELTDAEKLKILRERRAQKFKRNGAATERLNKITGETNLLSTESPLEKQQTNTTNSSTSSFHNLTSTEEMDELVHTAQKKTGPLQHSNQADNNATQYTNPDKEQKESLNAQIKLLKELVANEKDGNISSSTSDIDSEQVFQLLNGGNDLGNASPFGNIPINAGAQNNPQLVAYSKNKINKFKAWLVVIRWGLFLLPYIYFITNPKFDANSLTPSSPMLSKYIPLLFDKQNFFTVFITFEICMISIYYQFKNSLYKETKVQPLSTNKILSLLGMIPDGLLPFSNVQGKINAVLQYWDVFGIFLTDTAFVLVVVGVISYLHTAK
ncbi:GET complex subunit GET2 SCDLUD_000304 [Saccharomycodes ludwigii]|uniref:GET complex subunit GET2 n=1 Tax=Saccharomycodes ludwigii TaxID=36035 RepID=UPI001E8B4B4E|nr:hypothetical protein SCDLUD_000304 [Saccharomycodes ludwigii]KAH3902719.1 hypothetical protein SCDLUD_000304 [Saccharomycodes ludwigii]